MFGYGCIGSAIYVYNKIKCKNLNRTEIYCVEKWFETFNIELKENDNLWVWGGFFKGFKSRTN